MTLLLSVPKIEKYIEKFTFKKNIKFWRNPIGWLAQIFSESGMWKVESEIFQYGK